MLVLLDIDGTLLRGTPIAHSVALCLALGDVYGVEVTLEELRASDTAGRTDREIAWRVLSARGVPGDVIAGGAAEWCARAVERYTGVAGLHPDPVAMPDAADSLALLDAGGAATALVTGNIEDIAHDKLARAGLGGVFRRSEGGFGGDALVRADVVRTALRRAGTRAGDAVVVGDTPHDVSAARAAGCGVVAVATGAYPAVSLAGADHVAASLSEAVAVVLDGATAGAR